MPEPALKPADTTQAGPATGTMPVQRDLGKPESGMSPADRAEMKALFQANRPDRPATPAAPAAPAEPAKPAAPANPAAKPADAPEEGAKAPSSTGPLEADKLLEDSSFVPRKAEEWKKAKTEWRAKLDAVTAERDTLKKQIEGLGDPEALKALAAERDDLRKTLQAVAVERDPAFKSQFESQRKQYIEEARASLGEHGAEVAALLERHGGNAHPLLKEWAAKHDLGPWELQSLLTTVRGLRDLELNRDRMIQESAQNWERNVTQQTLAQQRAAEAAKRELASAVEERLEVARKGNGLFRQREDDEEWNKAVEASVENVRAYALGEHDAESRAALALQAAAYPLLVKEYDRLAKLYNETLGKAAALSGSQPGNGSSSMGAGSKEPTKEEEASMTVGQRILAGMRRSGVNPATR